MGHSILIIDDSASVRSQVKKILSTTDLIDKFYEAGNGIEGYKLLLNNKIDLILCDLVMPDVDGFKFLVMKRNKPELTDIPVIMVTGSEEVKNKIQGLEQGAIDYVTKPFDHGELLARVKAQLKIKKLQDELKSANVMLENLSNTDELTQVYNRRCFMNILKREFSRSSRYKSNLTCLMIDIDGFKNLNDTHGHQKGDEILVCVADILKSGLRKADVIARYGGEEFVIILPETKLKSATKVAERYREEVENGNFANKNGSPLKITISIGISTYPNKKIKTMDDLIKFADDALYVAKRNGKNRVEVAE